MPKEKAWRYFDDLGKKYGARYSFICVHSLFLIVRFLGPIIKLSLGGDNIVVLNNASDAEELVSLFVCVFYITLISLSAWQAF